MTITVIPAAGHTCTVRLTPVTTCGAPAVLGLKTARAEYFECEAHALPVPEPTAPRAPVKKAAPAKCRECGHVHTYGPCGVRVGPGKLNACSCTNF